MPPPPNTPEFDVGMLGGIGSEADENDFQADYAPDEPLSERSSHPDSITSSIRRLSLQTNTSTVRSRPSSLSGSRMPQRTTPERSHPPARPPRSPLPTPPIDYQDLEYVDDVDETLICPICRTPFHEPITTKRCGHTFCTVCLRRAIELQPVCPIDRQPISWHPDQLCNPRIVSHQLDRLKVRCPNAGCKHVATRGVIGTHYERDCKRTLVPCPDSGCDKLVPREDATSELGCLHKETRCRYCDAAVLLAEQERHYDTDCKGHTVKCLACSAAVVRHRMTDHVMNHCLETQTVCKFHSFGCGVAGTRRNVVKHEIEGCVYEAIGRLVRDRAEDRAVISNLRGRLTSFERAQQLRNTAPPRSPRPTTGDIPDLDLSVSSGHNNNNNDQSYLSGEAGAGNGAWDSAEDYMLAQFERMEAKIEDLRKMMTELDGRHSMMLLNETMPLKDQITELRSNLGVINMHTTWLMNVQRQNRVAAVGGGAQGQSQGQQGQRNGSGGGGGSATAGSVSGTGTGTGRVGEADERREFERQRVFFPPRRMSGENPPRL